MSETQLEEMSKNTSLCDTDFDNKLNEKCIDEIDKVCETKNVDSENSTSIEKSEHEQECLNDTCDKDHPSDKGTVEEKMHNNNLIIIERMIYKFFYRNTFIIKNGIILNSAYKQSILPTVMDFGKRLSHQLDVPQDQFVNQLKVQLPELEIILPQLAEMLQQLARDIPEVAILNNDMAYTQLFFIISVNIYLTTPPQSTDMLNWHFYFSAWDSPKLNEVYILNGTSGQHNATNSDIRNYIHSKSGNDNITVSMNRNSSPFCFVDLWGSSSYVYISNAGEDIQLFEFFYYNGLVADNFKENALSLNGRYIAQPFLTFSFPDLAFIPATKNKFPIQSGIEFIFDIMEIKQFVITNIPNYIRLFKESHGGCPPCFEQLIKMINYYSDDFNVSVQFPNGKNNLAKKVECLYDSDPLGEYNDFNTNMNSGNQGMPIQFSKFKKYLENYIVNYCTSECPSLKMVAFLKISYLNQFMISKSWGFVDTAGGSLFNYLKGGQNVVTADYDFKIYFMQNASENDIKKRKAFIKCWFINISHNINEYMRINNFLKDVKIVGQIVDTNISFEITPISKRHFISRGKEPDIFPVPLYSDDLLLSIKFSSPLKDEKGKPCSQSVNMNVSYFDLVFKDYVYHYMFPFSNIKVNPYEPISNVTLFECDKPFITPSVEDVQIIKDQPFFIVRTPSFYEIWMDVTSLLTDSIFLLNRMCTRKDKKDVKRVKILVDIILYYLTPEKLSELTPEQIEQLKMMLNEPTKQHLDLLNNDIWFKRFLLSIDLTNIHTEVIKNCYYQFTLFCENVLKQHYSGIKNGIQTSFATPFSRFTKIYWSFLLCTKKYTEFKAVTDITRINKIRDYDFNGSIINATGDFGPQIQYIDTSKTIIPSATYDKIIEKLSVRKRNKMNNADELFYSTISGFISPALGSIMAGGSSKKHTRKHRKKYKYSKKNAKSKKKNKSLKQKTKASKKNPKIKRRRQNTTKK